MNRINVDLSNLNRVEDYLKDHELPYERVDSYPGGDTSNAICCPVHHQICVYTTNELDSLDWDVICHPGSYGWEHGLLEVMGSILPKSEDPDYYDSVKGYLTAEDVISMCNAYYGFESL